MSVRKQPEVAISRKYFVDAIAVPYVGPVQERFFFVQLLIRFLRRFWTWHYILAENTFRKFLFGAVPA